MRKLVAVICVVALFAIMAVPAMANPSIGSLAATAVSLEALSPITSGWQIVVEEANPDLYEDEDVKEVVTKANDPEAVLTVKELVEALASKQPEGTVNDDGTITVGEKTIDPAEYDFVTGFVDIVLTDGTTVLFSNDGEVIAVKATLAIDALKGETDLEDYMILLVNPENGEVCFIELDSDSFDAETGEITVDFPCLGAFALIQA